MFSQLFVMNFSFILYFSVLFYQQQAEVPNKPFAEFEIQIDYQFKTLPFGNANTIDFDEKQGVHDKKQYGIGLRPYLNLNLKLLKLSDQEVKVRAVNNLGHAIFNKKVKSGETLRIVMGFTDDVKARVSPYEISIMFSSKEKKEVSRIYLLIREDGTFMVNGEIRGKF